MSKIILILIIITSYQSFSKGFGQSKISLNLQKVSLKKAFKEIEKKSDYHFLYNDNLINKNGQLFNLESANSSIKDVLNELLKNTNLTYQLNADNLVIISAKDNQAQAVTITGRVTDEKGEPIPGASVQIKGTSVGTLTDPTGKFSLTIPSDKTNAILVFSVIGYVSQEVEVGGRTSFDIKLKENIKSLSEVVVVGYGTQRRGDVSSAIASVKVEQMNKVPATNVATALQGQVPGLVVTTSSYRPGSGANIRIRGNRSLSATNDPLYVVDGVPVSYSIDDINPLDIEAIDVLKDASATAIYGSRGANGVIQITTKKGKSGRVTVDYSGSTSVDNILRKLVVFNGPEYAQFKRDAYIGGKAYNGSLSNSNTAQRYFPDPASDYQLFKQDPGMVSRVMAGYTFTKYDPTNNIFEFLTRPTTAEEKALMASLGYPVLDNVAVYDASKVTTTDWLKYGLQTGMTQNHNLSIAGGSEKFSSTFSGGFFKQKGIVPSQDYTRYSFSSSANYKPATFFTAGANVNFSHSIQNTGADLYSAVTGGLPLAEPYDANGNFVLFAGNDGNITNPLNDPKTVLNELRVNHFLSNVFAQINIMQGLSFKTTFGTDITTRRNGIFNGAQSSVRSGGAPTAQYNNTSGLTWTLQNQLSYNTTIAKKHQLSATAVQELLRNGNEVSNASATGLNYESQKWYSLQNNATGVVTYSGGYNRYQLASFLGRLIYTFDGKYTLTGAYRYDGSSVLSAQHQGKAFPSASLAWRLDQESFIKKLNLFDQLKLRVGIGSVGNSGISPYLTSGTLALSYYNFGNAAALGYYPNSLALPNLEWEKTTTKNLGIDYSFMQGRISGAIDVYESISNNIQPQKIPDASGYGNITVNLGKVRNRGIEVSLSTINIKTKDFRWSTDFVFSKNQEAITYLDVTGNNNVGSQWFIGSPVRSYYDYVAQGIFQNSDAQPGGILYDYYWKKAGNKSNTALQPGRIRVADLTGDTIITEADKKVIGSPNPKWTGSFNTTVSYKGLELSAFLYISRGGLVRNPRPSLVGRYQSLKVNYWTPTNPSNEYPQANLTTDIPLYWQANGFQDGSYARVRNILLSYQIPASILSKIKLRSLSVSVNAMNPFLFSKYKTYDPETMQYSSSYPSSSTGNPAPTSYSYRSFVFGIKAGI